MIDEIKKFYRTPAVVLLLVLALVMSVVMPIIMICDFESYGYSDGKGNTVKGFEAMRGKKAKVSKIAGALDADILNKAHAFKLSLGDKDSFHRMEEKYPGLWSLLEGAYSFERKERTRVDDFYEKSLPAIENRINQPGRRLISEAERQEVARRLTTIEKPYRYEFLDQWPPLMSALFFSYFTIAILGLVISSQLFSFEKETGMDCILATLEKKQLICLGLKKLLAMSGYLTGSFAICTVISSSIVVGMFGVSGWKAQIQMLPNLFTSMYSWSVGGMIVLSVLLSWISIVSIGVISSLINALFQRTYVSLLLATFLTVTPMFLWNSLFLPSMMQKFFLINPINGITIRAYIGSYFSYDLGALRVLAPTMILIVAVAFVVIGTVLSPVCFAKRIGK